MSDTTTYIATEPLFVGRWRAHNPGDEVPEDNIEPNGWTGKVAKAGTAEAAEFEAYDPARYGVDEVNAKLATVTDEERARILESERSGRNRKTVNGNESS